MILIVLVAVFALALLLVCPERILKKFFPEYFCFVIILYLIWLIASLVNHFAEQGEIPA